MQLSNCGGEAVLIKRYAFNRFQKEMSLVSNTCLRLARYKAERSELYILICFELRSTRTPNQDVTGHGAISGLSGWNQSKRSTVKHHWRHLSRFGRLKVLKLSTQIPSDMAGAMAAIATRLISPFLKNVRRSMPTDAIPNVLVVEDELMLRMRAVNIVEDAGFASVEATNADQALSILESRSDISLLFTDIQMPGSMDGLKLAYAVHERWPAIKIILVSGQITPAEGEKPADSRFFGKPLSDEKMIGELQAMVGAGALKAVPTAALLSADDVERTPPAHLLPQSKQEAVLTAENDSLRVLLEQAGIDAEVLLAQAGIDAKEREAADKLQKLILGELHHRIKNTLATVSAIASQSFRTAPTIEHGQKAMDGRLLAMSRAHDLLMQTSWANASLSHTLKDATEPYDSEGAGRFHFTGPDIAITSGAVIALAMTINELCTNTTKFGALSSPAGRVEILWKVDEETRRLNLLWKEHGGPLVQKPTRRSFGTRMMESVGQQLNGSVNLSYAPSGLVYTLDVPLLGVTGSA